MVKETSLKKGLQTPQYCIESTELERTHESTPGLAPQETHYVISVAFSQKAIPVPEGRT